MTISQYSVEYGDNFEKSVDYESDRKEAQSFAVNHTPSRLICSKYTLSGRYTVEEYIDLGNLSLAQLEEIYMDGFADDQVGDTDTFRHYYRVGNQLVETLSTGAKNVYTFDTEAEAIAEMEWLHEEFKDWEDSDA